MTAHRDRPNAAAAGTVAVGDLVVHRLGFGAMRITGPGVIGEPADPERAKAVLRRAVELGVNFIDTAEAYGPKVSERLIAEALYPYPAGLVIATKGGLLRPAAAADGSPTAVPSISVQALEGSLRRLRLERIDLYQLHRVDPKVPLEVSLGALVDAQSQGKIRHIGVSNVTHRAARRRPQGRPRRLGAEPLQSRRTGRPIPCSTCASGTGSRSCRGVPSRATRSSPARPACGGDCAAPRRHAGPGGARVAAPAVAGHAADPGDVLHRSSRGEHRRRGGAPQR